MQSVQEFRDGLMNSNTRTDGIETLLSGEAPPRPYDHVGRLTLGLGTVGLSANGSGFRPARALILLSRISAVPYPEVGVLDTSWTPGVFRFPSPRIFRGERVRVRGSDRSGPGLRGADDTTAEDADDDRVGRETEAEGESESAANEAVNDVPVTWRRRMQRQVRRLQRFLLRGEPYRALLMDGSMVAEK